MCVSSVQSTASTESPASTASTASTASAEKSTASRIGTGISYLFKAPVKFCGWVGAAISRQMEKLRGAYYFKGDDQCKAYQEITTQKEQLDTAEKNWKKSQDVLSTFMQIIRQWEKKRNYTPIDKDDIDDCMNDLHREVGTLINASTITPDHPLSQLVYRVKNKNRLTASSAILDQLESEQNMETVPFNIEESNAHILRTDIDALKTSLKETEQSNLNQKNTCKTALLTTLNKSFPNLNTSHFPLYSGDEPKQREDLNRIVKTALKSLESYSDPNITFVSSAKKSTLKIDSTTVQIPVQSIMTAQKDLLNKIASSCDKALKENITSAAQEVGRDFSRLNVYTTENKKPKTLLTGSIDQQLPLTNQNNLEIDNLEIAKANSQAVQEGLNTYLKKSFPDDTDSTFRESVINMCGQKLVACFSSEASSAVKSITHHEEFCNVIGGNTDITIDIISDPKNIDKKCVVVSFTSSTEKGNSLTASQGVGLPEYMGNTYQIITSAPATTTTAHMSGALMITPGNPISCEAISFQSSYKLNEPTPEPTSAIS